MAKIVGVEGLTGAQLIAEVQQGGKFVVFEYCVSIIIMTFKRGSGIHFLKAGQSAFGASFPYTLLSLLTGWWGIPWGPIHTIGSLATNLGGGKDVTPQVMAALHLPMPQPHGGMPAKPIGAAGEPNELPASAVGTAAQSLGSLTQDSAGATGPAIAASQPDAQASEGSAERRRTLVVVGVVAGLLLCIALVVIAVATGLMVYLS
jgi:hypothetical protein